MFQEVVRGDLEREPQAVFDVFDEELLRQILGMKKVPTFTTYEPDSALTNKPKKVPTFITYEPNSTPTNPTFTTYEPNSAPTEVQTMVVGGGIMHGGKRSRIDMCRAGDMTP